MNFNKNKMETFMQQDALIKRMVNQAIQNGLEYNNALEITFNSEVLEDSDMMRVYENL